MEDRGPQVAAAKPSFRALPAWAKSSAIIVVMAAIAAAPVRLHGPFCGDDLQFHAISWLDAQHSWRQGIAYPRWASSPNYGAGEPRFLFYPPLTWMLGAALGTLLPWSWVPAILTFLLLAATGLATRKLGRQLLPEAPAILAGCIAIFSFHALFTAYDRAAFGELTGGFWMPLLLPFALRDRIPEAGIWRRALDGSTVPLALVVAGAWLSNVPVGVMSSYLLAGVAIAAALLARSWFPILRASAAVLLGLATAAIYLVPAVFEQRWVDSLEATGVSVEPGLNIENNWLFGRNALPSMQWHNVLLYAVSWLVLAMIAIALASAAVVWMRHRRSTQSASQLRLWIVLACIPLAILFVQLPISLTLWNLLPKLRFLQFPWRWLVALEAPMAILLAAAILPGELAPKWKRAAAGFVVGAFLFASLFYVARTFFLECDADELQEVVMQYPSGAGFWGSAEYAPPGTDNSVVARHLPDACLTADPNVILGKSTTTSDIPEWNRDQNTCVATISASVRKAGELRISATATQAGYVILRLRSYPAWRLTLNGQPPTLMPQRADGLIAIPVPKGPLNLKAFWINTPDVIVGRWTSAFALISVIILWIFERRRI